MESRLNRLSEGCPDTSGQLNTTQTSPAVSTWNAHTTSITDSTRHLSRTSGQNDQPPLSLSSFVPAHQEIGGNYLSPSPSEPKSPQTEYLEQRVAQLSEDNRQLKHQLSKSTEKNQVLVEENQALAAENEQLTRKIHEMDRDLTGQVAEIVELIKKLKDVLGDQPMPEDENAILTQELDTP